MSAVSSQSEKCSARLTGLLTSWSRFYDSIFKAGPLLLSPQDHADSFRDDPLLKTWTAGVKTGENACRGQQPLMRQFDGPGMSPLP